MPYLSMLNSTINDIIKSELYIYTYLQMKAHTLSLLLLTLLLSATADDTTDPQTITLTPGKIKSYDNF